VTWLHLALAVVAWHRLAAPLLEDKPALLMGMDPAFYMTLAAFVEFNIVFVLFSSASVFLRFTALGLNALFVLAIFEFGMIDAAGHLVIIVVLVMLTARGRPRPLFSDAVRQEPDCMVSRGARHDRRCVIRAISSLPCTGSQPPRLSINGR